MLTQNLFRYAVLPAFETLYKRRQTFRYWRELEASQWQTREELATAQTASLKSLVAHAQRECPYYAELIQHRGLDADLREGVASLRRFPLLTKADIRRHQPQMRAANLAARLMTKATGGSTGVPLQIQLDQGSLERRTAAMWRGYNWAGAGPGTKQFFLWGVPIETRPVWRDWKDQLYNAILRRRVFSAFELQEAVAPQLASLIAHDRPDAIVAYTSAIYTLARNLQERGIRPFAPKSIVVGAEKLHDFQRVLIEDVFQAPVFETYGCREFMMIGGECPEHRGLHLTMENLFVEILDDDGTPTRDGHVGNVVVTDLYNYGMPMIRYVTGDQAIAGFGVCPCGRGLPTLSEVRGRTVDTIQTPDGRQVPGAFFPHLMKDFAGVRQFQVVQSTREQLELRVVLGDEWRDESRTEILRRVRRAVGEQVELAWRPVEHIPLTSAGKHRVVVSELSC
ncbi:MAG: hypothetical protein U0939_13795 [Pirellulales bacterium]